MRAVWINELREQTLRAGGTCSEPAGENAAEKGEDVAFLTSPSARESSSPMSSPYHISKLLESYRHFCGHLQLEQAFFMGFLMCLSITIVCGV